MEHCGTFWNIVEHCGNCVVKIALWKLCCGNCVVECKIGKKGGRKEERIEEGRKEGKKEGRKEYAHSCVSFCKTEHATVSLLGMCDYLTM